MLIVIFDLVLDSFSLIWDLMSNNKYRRNIKKKYSYKNVILIAGTLNFLLIRSKYVAKSICRIFFVPLDEYEPEK